MGFPSQNTFRSVVASKPIYIFDTNMYLNLLRYSKQASTEVLNLYREVSLDIRVPTQVYKEFLKNLPIVNSQRSRDIKDANTVVKNAINSCSSAIQKQLDLMIRRKFENAPTISSEAISDLEEIKNSIDNYVQTIIKDQKNFLCEEEVKSFVEDLWTAQKYEEYLPSRLFEIYKNGVIRYQYKIPPGYMDDPQNNKESKKNGVDIFGDLILWNQTLDFGHKEKRSVVFVTADVKEDWFELSSSKHPIAPRQELIDEFSEQTNGLDICILTSELFIEYFGKIKSIDTEAALLEMQLDDFVDITVRNNSLIIIETLLAWANEGNHILQFPFPEDINKLLSIENMRTVIKSASLQIKEGIEYSTVLQGTADFLGVNYDTVKKCNISARIVASFLFDLRITFTRSYECDERGQCVPSKKVGNIKIANGIFEAVPSTDVSLESKRGTFILPTDNDQEIYDYMESIWDEYESANPSIDKAEALVYFDAAKHFECSLLEINRAYTLVQNQKSKINLSLNEIDALALKRFSDIQIKVENGNATFAKLFAPLGEAYSTPESMMILPPENGKKIDVTFTIEVEQTEAKFIKITGTTSLPVATHLMLSLTSTTNSYHAQSKVEVGENGTFASETFSNSKNPDAGAMLHGVYTLEIVTPIFSVQPESVKVMFGAKGRNLAGDYVSEDTIFGKTVRFTKNFEI